MHPIPTLHTKRLARATPKLRGAPTRRPTLGMVLGDPRAPGERARTFISCRLKYGVMLDRGVGHSDDIKAGSRSSIISANIFLLYTVTRPLASGHREAEAALHAASLQAEHFLSAYVVPGSM